MQSALLVLIKGRSAVVWYCRDVIKNWNRLFLRACLYRKVQSKLGSVFSPVAHWPLLAHIKRSSENNFKFLNTLAFPLILSLASPAFPDSQWRQTLLPCPCTGWFVIVGWAHVTSLAYLFAAGFDQISRDPSSGLVPPAAATSKLYGWSLIVLWKQRVTRYVVHYFGVHSSFLNVGMLISLSLPLITGLKNN